MAERMKNALTGYRFWVGALCLFVLVATYFNYADEKSFMSDTCMQTGIDIAADMADRDVFCRCVSGKYTKALSPLIFIPVVGDFGFDPEQRNQLRTSAIERSYDACGETLQIGAS